LGTLGREGGRILRRETGQEKEERDVDKGTVNFNRNPGKKKEKGTKIHGKKRLDKIWHAPLAEGGEGVGQGEGADNCEDSDSGRGSHKKVTGERAKRRGKGNFTENTGGPPC